MAVNPIPEGYRTLTPYTVVDGADAFISFAKDVFGATERMRMAMPGDKVGHAELELGDSVLMVADHSEFWEVQPIMLHIYVEDVDALYAKALAAGATSRMEPADQFYGDRMATVVDKWGNNWSLATHIEDVSDEEMERRTAEALANM